MLKNTRLKKKNIIGHSDIAPLRKIDPGEKFPWKKLASSKIGVWHQCKPYLLKKLRKVKISKKQNKIKFVKYLQKIGYCSEKNNKFHFAQTSKAFQRHYRKDLINGVLDQECFIIAQNLAKNL